ncbi:hypothetical protein SDC9_163842 [bioreactor metagenome]|uniref:Uncharacterized protein n=1 Tax=bioreactor metagenome TaxID=1076179 RepID=A0A645FPZ0_9ZZZZ|nr:hypothetical protein [Romboutsia lituseburensis]
MGSITKLLIFILAVITVVDSIKDFSSKTPQSNYKYLKCDTKDKKEIVDDYKIEIFDNDFKVEKRI